MTSKVAVNCSALVTMLRGNADMYPAFRDMVAASLGLPSDALQRIVESSPEYAALQEERLASIDTSHIDLEIVAQRGLIWMLRVELDAAQEKLSQMYAAGRGRLADQGLPVDRYIEPSAHGTVKRTFAPGATKTLKERTTRAQVGESVRGVGTGNGNGRSQIDVLYMHRGRIHSDVTVIVHEDVTVLTVQGQEYRFSSIRRDDGNGSVDCDGCLRIALTAAYTVKGETGYITLTRGSGEDGVTQETLNVLRAILRDDGPIGLSKAARLARTNVYAIFNIPPIVE